MSEIGKDKIRLMLFIVSQSKYSERAIREIHDVCENNLKNNYILQVIDVIERPELAEKYRIIATPTLVRLHPEPPRRLIGDLSDGQKIMEVLKLPVSK